MTQPRVPKQKRSTQMKERVAQAALELFSESGYYNVTTNDIARRAGVSIGTLYSYYEDKRDIYRDLVDKLYRNVLDRMVPEEVTPDNSPFDLIRKYVTIVLESHAYMTDFQKQITALSYQDEEFRRLEEAGRSFASEKIEELIMNYGEYLQVDDLETTSFIVRTTLEAIIHEHMFFPNDLDTQRVIDETTKVIYRYLFCDAPAS